MNIEAWLRCMYATGRLCYMARTNTFTLSTEVNGYRVTFALQNSKSWVLVTFPKGSRNDAVNSLDNPKKAVRYAAQLVDPSLWPAYAANLLVHLSNRNATLF